MDLSAGTLCLYVEHAFHGMSNVLDRVNDKTVNERPAGWGTNSIVGLIVHCCELAPSWFEGPGLGRESHRDREAEFEATATVDELRQRIARSLEKAQTLAEQFAAGPTASDHELRVFLPRGDTSDGALAVHVLEELFQHLGHMEVTADALAGDR